MDILLFIWYQILLPLLTIALNLAPILVFVVFARLWARLTSRRQGKKTRGRFKGKGDLPRLDQPARRHKQAIHRQKKRRSVNQTSQKPAAAQKSGHGRRQNPPAPFSQLSKKWQKEAKPTVSPSQKKKSAETGQPVQLSREKTGTPPADQKKDRLSPRKTRLKSRYADRAINIQIENLDGHHRQPGRGLSWLDLNNVKEGIVWQAILEPPKAHQK